MPETIKTRLTELLGIKYPILLAGMNAVAHSDLVAARTAPRENPFRDIENIEIEVVPRLVPRPVWGLLCPTSPRRRAGNASGSASDTE